ncbi:hypothetical protein [Larkinella arboricola]|nr:hypothetical protein [Larkinella arboricola]
MDFMLPTVAHQLRFGAVPEESPSSEPDEPVPYPDPYEPPP